MSSEQSLAAASRPQIGIDRLPARRVSTEPREAMNCKSCRKRKIKCNRTRPTCEACQVFNCACIYDAVPKKRGPKTDVLEALLKRVDGLEKRLVTEGKSDDAEPGAEAPPSEAHVEAPNGHAAANASNHHPHPPPVHAHPLPVNPVHQLRSPVEPLPAPQLAPDLLVDTYFARLHGKPYFILDEATTRSRLQAGQLPSYLACAIYAVSTRYAPHYGGYASAVRLGQDYACRARLDLDIDEPSIETLQALLLLSQASFQSGKGKKTFMLLTSAISMAFALDLHRELPPALKVTPAEREGRRRLFWSCYLMDRFAATGSKRPALIADECISLRLPSWQLHAGAMLLEGDYFPSGSNLQYMGGAGKGGQGSMGMLIGIARTLGITNRYLAAGGVKGDSHFPWHSLSNLSKIRQELDMWAADTQDTFTSIDALFGQPDSSILVLSKLVYHLIHCLIYRPFLPVDLAELSGTSQHQPWQIEATNLCFLHANAIAELVEIGRASSLIDWSDFVGYCVCTAGTIHIHGAHYPGREGEVFSVSAEFLSREMQQLSELRWVWQGVQHQRDTLQAIYGCHTELVESLASNPMRYAPVFQLEDFFDRYPGQVFDGAHVTFLEIVVDASHESMATFNIEQRNNLYLSSGLIGPPQGYRQPSQSLPSSVPHYTNSAPSKKRKNQAAHTKTAPPPPQHQPAPAQPSRPDDSTLPKQVEPGAAVNPPPQYSPPPAPATLPSTTNNGLHLPYSPTFSFSPLPQFANLAPSPLPRTPSLTHHNHHHPPAQLPPHPQHLQQPQQPQQHQPYPDTNSTFDPTLVMPAPYDPSPQPLPTQPAQNASSALTQQQQQQQQQQQHPQTEQHPTPTGSTSADSDRDSAGNSTSGRSGSGGAGSVDPFLSLLEQLAENEGGEGGLDFFLAGGGG